MNQVFKELFQLSVAFVVVCILFFIVGMVAHCFWWLFLQGWNL